MYLYCVLLWPDDGCFTAETCCLEVNYKILSNFLLLYVVILDGNKYLLLLPIALRPFQFGLGFLYN